MDRQQYQDYLRSEEWKERRIMLLEEADWICDECGEPATCLHHLKYDNIGDEELDEDVIPLCNQCHRDIHEEKGDKDDYDEW